MHILGVHYDFPFLQITRIRKTRKAVEVLWTKTISLTGVESAEGEAKSEPPKRDALLETPNLDVKRQYNTPKTEAVFGGPYLNVKQQYTDPKKDAFLGTPSLNVKRLYMKNFRGKVVSGLSVKDFLIRPFDVKIASKKHIEEAIAFQSEALSHFKPGEVITVPMIENTQKGKADGLLFTVPKEGLKKHLQTLENCHIEPDVVSTIPSALCHFIHWKFPDLNQAFIIDLGSNVITCALLEKGSLKKAHAISMGIEDLLRSIYEDRKRILLKKEIEGAAKQMDLLLLKTHLNPRLYEQLSLLRQELSKIYFSFTRDVAKPVIFTGRTDAFIHLPEFLFEFSPNEWPLSIEEQKSAVSVGLALSQIAKKPLQLRREEFFPRKNWARMGLIALSLLAGSISLSIALIALGFQSANWEKKKMLTALLSPVRKDLLQGENMEEKIDQWIYAIEKNNKEYPYIIQAPKVTEILTWLSTHPLLEELKQQGDPIDIRKIRTQLVNFPAIHSENEPYLAKMEMEFNFKSMMNARKFHEALRKGDQLVNPNLEITWDALTDSYRTTFFLKNRSPYVP